MASPIAGAGAGAGAGLGARLLSAVARRWRAAKADDLLIRSTAAPVDAIVERPLVVSGATYRVGRRETRTVVLRERPRTITAGWMAQLLALEVEGVETSITVALHVEPLPNGAASRFLQRKRAEYESTMAVDERLGRTPSPETAVALADTIETQEALASGMLRLFSVGAVVTCEADVDAPPSPTGRRPVEELSAAVEDRLRGMLADCHPADDEHDAGFRSSLPTGRAPRVRRTWDTTELAYSWPCVGNAVSMPPGPTTSYLGYDLDDPNQAVYLDFFDHAGGPEAPTVAVVGTTGSGKTALMQKLITEAMGQESPPHEILAVDPKGDLLPLAAHLGGAARVVSFAGGGAPNVCAIGEYAEGVNAVHEQIKVVTGWLDLAASTGGRGEVHPLLPAESAHLSAAARAIYEEAGIDPDRPTTWTRPAPTVREAWGALYRMGSPLAERIAPFAIGEYKEAFVVEGGAAPRAGLVVYDLSGLDERHHHLATYMVMAEGWRRALADRRHRMLLLDEIREILRNPVSATLPGRAYAMGRSLKLMTVGAAQTVADWESTEQGRRALDNAATVFLGRQASGPNMAAVRHRWPSLTDSDALYLTASGGRRDRDRRGEFLLLTRGGRARVKVDLTALERGLFESDPDVRAAEKVKVAR